MRQRRNDKFSRQRQRFLDVERERKPYPYAEMLEPILKDQNTGRKPDEGEEELSDDA